MSDKHERPARTTKPEDRLSRLCAAMTDALEAHPEFAGDKAVVFLTGSDDRCTAHLSGYESDTDALVDVFVHMRAIARANGKDIEFIGIPDDVSGLDS